ncbi:MAG: polyprenyl synthetase family protein, partial [Defluviitaleaceae bacterium]|nr:polyprenyl synthetase family protein [Defluviitaleaceae bacterium]
IHDDLPAMDDDDMRRGRPSNHKAFDEATAILAGDALLNYAYEIMMDFCAEHNQLNYLNAMSTIAHCAGAFGMISGQSLDIMLEGKSMSIADLNSIYLNKTAKLFIAACVAGALCAEQSGAAISIMESFGRELGLVFQLKDDFLDNSPNIEIFGRQQAEQMFKSYPAIAANALKSVPKSEFLLALARQMSARSV